MKLKDTGLLPEKENPIIFANSIGYSYSLGSNDTIDKIGNIEIKLDVEKVEKLLLKQVDYYSSGTVTKERGYLISLYDTAKAIVSAFDSGDLVKK